MPAFRFTNSPALRACPDGVTIAIPNWNHEFFLPRSISSALKAVREMAGLGVPAEVLVIDDSSRDGSLPLLRQLETLFYEEGLRVLALAQNGGLGAARNQALQHAGYRYLVFLDADNELVAENLSLFYRAIRDTQSAVVYGNLIFQDTLQEPSRLLSYESFRERMFTENYIDACALVDRVQLHDSGGYQTSSLLHGWDDWEINLHLATQGRRLTFVPLAFAIYYALPNSLIQEVVQRVTPAGERMRRIYNQLGVRHTLPHNTERMRYHPDIGYL